MATGQKPTSEETNSDRIGITPGALGGRDDPKHYSMPRAAYRSRGV